MSADRRPLPTYAIGTRVTAPMGIALVHNVRWGPRSQAYLVEVAYDDRPGVHTYFEKELGQPGTESKPPVRLTAVRFVPGEAVHTPQGAAVVRNIVPTGDGCARAIVQLIGAQCWREFPLADLSPPLEAA